MPFEWLIELATYKVFRSGEFDLLDPGGGERHGAWEWTWAKPREGGGSCYAALAAIGPIAGTYTLEVWAGADDGAHFGRYLVREFHEFRDAGAESIDKDTVVASLSDAAQRASSLPDAALTDTYIRPIEPAS